MKRLKHRSMLLSKDLIAAREGATRLWTPAERSVRQRVTTAMDLPRLPTSRRQRGSVWAVAMVKNEADIIGQTIDHLLGQGVDGVLVVDNNSTDATPEVLASRADGERVFIGQDAEPAYFQAQKMRYLARWASKAGAEWIVPFDADEWWYGVDESLAATLRASTTPIVAAVIHNAFPSPSTASMSEPGWRVDCKPARLEKVAYRVHPVAALHHGNHGVSRPGRTSRPLRILHFPWRSRAQFHSKVAIGSAAIEMTGPRAPGGGGDHWRDLGRATAELDHIWVAMLAGQGDSRLEWGPGGELVDIDPKQWSDWDPIGVLG